MCERRYMSYTSRNSLSKSELENEGLARTIGVLSYVSVMCVFFFFSSRRRHTRCSRDWSSDVCSSDLGLEVVLREHGQWLLRVRDPVLHVVQVVVVGGVDLLLHVDRCRLEHPAVLEDRKSVV